MELTVLNIELGTTITHCFNLSSDTVKHKQPVRMFALKKHFWKNPRLRLTILKAIMTVTNVGSTIYNLRKILFISPLILWGNFEKHQSKTCSESPGVKTEYDGKSRWSNHQQSSCICDWQREDGLCLKYNRWDMPTSSAGKCQLHHFKSIILTPTPQSGNKQWGCSI